MEVYEIVSLKSNKVINELDRSIYDLTGTKKGNLAASKDPALGILKVEGEFGTVMHGPNTPKYIPKPNEVVLDVIDDTTGKTVSKKFFAVRPNLVPDSDQVLYFEKESVARTYIKSHGGRGGVSFPTEKLNPKDVQAWAKTRGNVFLFDEALDPKQSRYKIPSEGPLRAKLNDANVELTKKSVGSYVKKYDALVSKHMRRMIKVLQNTWLMRTLRSVGVLTAMYTAFSDFIEGIAEAYERGSKQGGNPYDEVISYIRLRGPGVAKDIAMWWIGIIAVGKSARLAVRFFLSLFRSGSLVAGPFGVIASIIATIGVEAAMWWALSTEAGKKYLISWTESIVEFLLGTLLNDLRQFVTGGDSEFDVKFFTEGEVEKLTNRIAREAAKSVGADGNASSEEDLVKDAEQSVAPSKSTGSKPKTIDQAW
jgi:hypothetical protein